ncbi:hypothetical protein SSX86_013227 [Deinandra increscens subsp. villosa]|uniref:Major facilitator superfamily (MFS) profile domain-containing protein n=1 Tax=Deinandra increscens subsp. villosa TaxID=3103831 RepID=A0AAP0D793_9ASTR
MTGGSLPISPYSPPKLLRPPDAPVCRKLICFDSNSNSNSNSKFHLRFKVDFLSGVHVYPSRLDVGRNYQVWRIRSDVKSESYEVSKSAPGSFKFKEKLGVDVRAEDGDEFVDNAVPWWEEFPKRWTIVILCFSAFLLCNMDRVNMSIAILPMSSEYHWNSTTVGLIQSSFFWGYLLTQIAGGIWADTVGGKRVLAFGVIWWSVATVLTPVAAKLGLPFLLIVRAFMGIGEGVAMPAMNNLLSKWVPVAERSRSLALVNMSIAILPMSSEYHWNSTTVGLIQSSFFWGYLLTQIAGGIWADTVGGKRVLAFGVIWWSVATVLTPVAAKLGLPFLLIVRAFMGIGEGVAMPAMNNLLSKWVPVAERSRSLALVYSGMYLGSVTGLAFSPFLIHSYGWPSVFFSFGSLGTVWATLWLNKAYSSPLEDPELRPAEKKLIFQNRVSEEPVKSIPWGLILSKPPVWALITCHFCHNWGTFILLTWMPTYYNQVLGFNLTESGLFCVLPWLTMAFSANLGGWIADTLVSKGWSVTTVRKGMQSIGFLGPAFFLSQLSHVDSPAMAVLCMACSQGSDAFSQSGLYSNHQDIAPRYSGVLLGLSNTAGVLAGVLGTAATGYILQHGSWDEVFDVAIGLYLVGTVIWNLFSTGEKIID